MLRRSKRPHHSALVTSAHEALRLTAFCNVSSIRVCQPSPSFLKCSITLLLRRIETSSLVGALFGPRPLRIEAARPGNTFENGLALAKSALVNSGLSPTSFKSLAVKPRRFLEAFMIQVPFVLARGTHAYNADTFTAETGEHNHNDAARIHADGTPAFWLVPCHHESIFKKCFVEVGKIQPVLFQVGAALRLVPNDFHNLIVVTI